MLRRPVLAFTSLLLLAVMAVQLVQVASFEVRRMGLRREMKQHIRQGLPDHELVRFSFSPAEYEALEKEDGGREFWVAGHIYDVVRRSTGSDGSVHIEAVDDRDEARLMAGLNELLQDGMARKGMGRDRARILVAAFATALPLGTVRLAYVDAGEGLRFPAHGDAVLDRAAGERFHPPRS